MRSTPRRSYRRRPGPESLEPRCVLSGNVPPGMDLAQANWFYQNTFAAPASVAPEWNGNVASGDAGSLGANYLAAIIARVNDYRWMAGLPGGVTLDPTENAADQQAALMVAANDELSHSPPPTWLDYSAAGADAAAHSDLTLGASGVTAIDLYMTDPGASNTFVGHRRWILDPTTRTMGVGDIPADSNALYVVQPQVPPAPDVTAVAWPPAGFVPAPLMPERWSLQYDVECRFLTGDGGHHRKRHASNCSDPQQRRQRIWRQCHRVGHAFRPVARAWTANGLHRQRRQRDDQWHAAVILLHHDVVRPEHNNRAVNRCPPRSSSFSRLYKSLRMPARS